MKFLSKVVDSLNVKPETYDVFLSHAGYGDGGDKAGIVSQLEIELGRAGLRVFLDSKCLELGDEARPKMVWAAVTSKVFVAVLSPAYADRKWTQKEMDLALATRGPPETFHSVVEKLPEDEKKFIKHIATPKPVEVVPLFFRLTPDQVQSLENENRRDLGTRFTGKIFENANGHTHAEYAKEVASEIVKKYFRARRRLLVALSMLALIVVGFGVGVPVCVSLCNSAPADGLQPVFDATTAPGPSAQKSVATSTNNPTVKPSPTPSLLPLPCGGNCQTGMVCLEDSCCGECKRITLESVHTDGDGLTVWGRTDITVEPTFFVNGVKLFGGELQLPADQHHTFSAKPDSVGNIRPSEAITFRVVERDDVSNDDESQGILSPQEWLRPGQTRYESVTVLSHDDSSGVNYKWTLYYIVSTECCE